MMDSPPGPEPCQLLRRSMVFQHLAPDELDSLLHEMAWFWLPGGGLLYRRGEASDALYLLKSGSLGVFGAPRLGTSERLLGLLSAGMTAGEVGLITNDARSHTVRALRDSELLRLPGEGFDRLVARHPRAMLGAARVAIQRLLAPAGKAAASAPRTFAILPFDRAIDPHEFADKLRRQLLAWGDCITIDAQMGKRQDTDWFSAREAESRFVLYVDDGDASWRRLCQRQADALLLLVDAQRAPAAWPSETSDPLQGRTPIWPHHPEAQVEHAHHRPRHLILRQPPDRIIPGAAEAWRATLGPGELSHHHWRHDADIARLARLVSGNSTGLVLSGGGARGFAQIGVIQALRASGIAIDSVVGTSVGAIIGGGIASEWDDSTMRDNCRRTMVEGKPLSDWTIPLVALTRGQRATNLLQQTFGAKTRIEDLPIRFACVSADLTSGTTAVHREGPLWRWVRASIAIPGILPPLFHAGHVYVDGSVVNNLPTDVIVEEGHGRIIAVDIGADDTLIAGVDEAASPPWPTLWAERRTQNLRPSAFAILLRAGMVNSESGSAHRRELADLLLRPDMQRIGMFEWEAFDRAIEIGYRHTREVLRKAPIPGPAKSTVPMARHQ